MDSLDDKLLGSAESGALGQDKCQPILSLLPRLRRWESEALWAPGDTQKTSQRVVIVF